ALRQRLVQRPPGPVRAVFPRRGAPPRRPIERGEPGARLAPRRAWLPALAAVFGAARRPRRRAAAGGRRYAAADRVGRAGLNRAAARADRRRRWAARRGEGRAEPAVRWRPGQLDAALERVRRAAHAPERVPPEPGGRRRGRRRTRPLL